METITIREATAADVETVYALICELEQRELSREGFQRAFDLQRSDERYRCLLAEEGARALAMLNMRMEWQLHHAARIAEVMELVVVPAARSKGVGKRLLDAARNIARAEGCAQIELESNRRRLDAHRFYLREQMTQGHVGFTQPLPEEQ